MSDTPIADSTLLNSIIGEGTRFRGEFEINGLLRIDGDFEGTIRTLGKVLVGLNGRARCNIYAETAVVGGVVEGNIFCSEKLIILSTGMVVGSVGSPRLVVEEGVILNGDCRIVGRQSVGAELPALEKAKTLQRPLETVVSTSY